MTESAQPITISYFASWVKLQGEPITLEDCLYELAEHARLLTCACFSFQASLFHCLSLLHD